MSGTASPFTDQILAAMDHAARLAPHNAHLVEDTFIDEVVRLAADARPDATGDFYPSVRIVSTADLHIPMADMLDTLGESEHAACCRCYLVTFRREPVPTDMTTKRLHIAAGATIVELWFCLVHADELDRDFAPVVWVE